jgi:glucose/mannose transport system permease protein
LRGVPEDLREAARVDGASEWDVYRYVILPMLQPITLSAMIVLGHISLKIFDLVYGMGGGDNPYIDMPGVNMYFTAFRGGAIGRGAAIAIILLIMVAFVIVPYLRSSLKAETEV